MYKKRCRQIHLDFHTSERIDDIGGRFNKKDFQTTLKNAHVNSINIFAKCHHGWAYFPSEKNEIHPNLTFDLLGEMIEACHEVDIETPIYISAGLDEKMARRHPEWLIRNQDETMSCFGVLKNTFMEPGYHEMCFNSPYLEYLLDQIEEVLMKYDGDGLFLDIVGERTCYCQNCIKTLQENHRDPRNIEDVKWLAKRTFKNYVDKVKERVASVKPGTPIFHNSGHIMMGRRDLLLANSHAEIESLPTGGWGYENFPLTANYITNKVDFYTGMTGKFHTTWGEFGGFKHPNALKYETALMLSHGAGCNIGDQLHPLGTLDKTTYDMIGTAYKEVMEKEEWCIGAKAEADVAFLAVEAVYQNGCIAPNISEEKQKDVRYTDIGCVKVLQEGHILYDVIDIMDDFEKYKLIILPDYIRLNEEYIQKIRQYTEKGGKILATGVSGLKLDKDEFGIELGVRYKGENKNQPNYIYPEFTLENIGQSPYIAYTSNYEIEQKSGILLAYSVDSYFNRETYHFCSHQHSPHVEEYNKPGIVKSTNGIYIGWKLFEEYAKVGSYIIRDIVLHCIEELLDEKTLKVNLPSQGITTLRHQKEKTRYIHHLLYAQAIKRGAVKLSTNPRDKIDIEVIEDILPLYNVHAELKVKEKITNVYLAPQMEKIPFYYEKNRLCYEVQKVNMHQMVVLEY